MWINVFKFWLDFTGMLVSNGSPQACCSPIEYVSLQWISDRAFRSGMLVSDGACWLLMKHV